MSEFFARGGWGMNPTLVFGVILIVLAVSSTRLDRTRLLTMAGAALATLLSGLLGFVLGVSRTLQAAADSGDENLVLVGTSESLNNVTLALLLVLLALAVGGARLLRRRAT